MHRSIVVACLAASSLSTSNYSVLGGSVGFAAPEGWREVRRADTDSTAFVAFALPRPGANSSAPPGNVMVDIALSHRGWDLKTYSDAKAQQVAAGPGSPVMVDSRFWDEDKSRTVLWSSQLRATPYVLWDKYAVRDTIYLDIRTAIPTAYASDSDWQRHYQAALDSLLASLCVGTQHVFQAGAIPCPNIEHVLPFSPDENADGARFVWLIFRHQGMPMPYVSAQDLPGSTDFRSIPADSARDGDVAWWPSLVGLYDAGSKALLLLEGERPMAEITQRLGAPHFYRRLVPR